MNVLKKIMCATTAKTKLPNAISRLYMLLMMLMLLCLPPQVMAEGRVQIARAVHPPVLADYVAGVPADAGSLVSGFRQNSPGDGSPASLETSAYLSYDDTHFYAVFVAKDDPELVRARISKRKDFPGDDYVVLELDTFHDKQRSFVFFVNPYGVQLDAKRTEGQETDFDFETQWQSDGQMTKDGYVSMMAIPFKSLRFRTAEVQEWGIAVGRVIARLNEVSYWPYITRRVAGFVPQMASADIDAKLAPGRNFQLNPYVYFGKSRVLNKTDATAPFWETENKTRAGLDAKLVIADAFALDLTVNPDFSEVESDEPQVIIDKRYETLFPEKRPFFLENTGFFQTPQPLFFSRRILEPKIGARLTGRAGNWSLGGLLINDDAPGKLLAPEDKDAGKHAAIVVARAQNDFASGANAGVLLTRRTLGGTSNTVAGADLRYKLDENWAITGQLAHSQSSSDSNSINNEALSTQGHLAFLEAKRTSRDFSYSGNLLDISANFDTALAFLPRKDLQQTTQTAAYLWNYTNQAWLQSMGPKITAIASRDQQHHLQDWSSDLAYIANGEGGTTLEAHLLNGYELFAANGFNKHGFLLSASSEALSWLLIELKAGKNEAINYAPATSVSKLLGDARSLSAIMTIKPFAQLKLEQTLLWNDMRTQQSDAGLAAGSLVYRDLLSRSRLSYQHNRYLGVRLVLDYDFLKADSRLTQLKAGKRLNSDLQFSYVLSPGTTLYAGYTDRQENLHLIGNPRILQATDNLDLHTGRKVFAKFNYLFQL